MKKFKHVLRFNFAFCLFANSDLIGQELSIRPCLQDAAPHAISILWENCWECKIRHPLISREQSVV